MSASERPPVLAGDDQAQLTTLVCNYLSLGQLELARACTLSLHALNPVAAKQVLVRAASGGGAGWPVSRTFPAQLRWFCFGLLRELADEGDSASTEALSLLDFDVLLEIGKNACASDVFSRTVQQELRIYRKTVAAASATPDETQLRLSAETLAALTCLLQDHALLGQIIIHQLLSDSGTAASDDDIARLVIGMIMEELGKPAVRAARVYELLRCLRLQYESRSLPVNELLEALLKQALEHGESAKQPVDAITRTGIIQALMAAPSVPLLRSFGALQDSACKLTQHPPFGPLPPPFVKLRTVLGALTSGRKQSSPGLLASPSKSPSLAALSAVASGAQSALQTAWQRQSAAAHASFWREWLVLCRVNRLHCVEYIIEYALACVIKNKLDDAAALTLPVPAVRPLVVLLAWEKLRGIQPKQRLLEALWEDGASGHDRAVATECQQLAYQTSVAWWCAQQLSGEAQMLTPVPTFSTTKSAQAASFAASIAASVAASDATVNTAMAEMASRVLNDLREKSVVYVMREQLHVLSADEVLAAVSRRPVPPDNENIRQQREIDLSLLHSFYATSAVLSLLRICMHRAPSTDEIRAAIDVARKHVMAIDRLSIRTGVLENLFCLLFLQRQHYMEESEATASDSIFPVTEEVLRATLNMCRQAINAALFDGARQLSGFTADETTIENVLCEHPSVRSAVVLVGARTDGRAVAFVQPVDGSFISDAVLAHVRVRLPAYMVPVELLVRDGTLNRDLLRQEYLAVFAQQQPAQLVPPSPQRRFDSAESTGSLPGVFLAGSPANTIVPRMHPLQIRLHELLEHVEDAIYRCEIAVAALAVSTDIPDSANSAYGQLLPTMLTEPSGLFAMCMRRDMIDRCLEIAHRYHLPAEMDQLAHLALHVSQLRELLEASSEPLTLDSHLNLSPFESFLVATDLALSAPPFHIQSLLQNAADALDNYTRETSLGLDRTQAEVSPIAPYTHVPTAVCTAMSAYLQRLRMLTASFPAVPLHTLLSYIVPYPRKPAELSEYLQQQTAEQAALQELRAQAELPDAQQARVLQDAIQTFTRRNQPDHPLVQFLQYVVGLGSALQDGTYLESISELPEVILAKLVFQGQSFATAERIARLMHLDLVAVLLRAAVTHPDQFPLSEEVLHFVEKESPLLATLAAAIVNADIATYPRLLDYAVSRAEADTPMHRWLTHQKVLRIQFSDVFAQPPSVRTSFTDDELAELHELIAGEHTIAAEQEFHTRAVLALEKRGALTEAVALADEFLPGGAPDDLLMDCVEAATDKSVVHSFIKRVRDGVRASTAALLYMRYWDAGTATDTLSACVSKITDDDGVIAGVQKAQKHLALFVAFTNISSQDWATWQDASEACKADVMLVVRRLLALNAYQVALDALAEFATSAVEMRVSVEHAYILYLLNEDALPEARAAKAAQHIIDLGASAMSIVPAVVKKVSLYSTKLFIVHTLLTENAKFLSAEELKELESIQLGLQVLTHLPAELQERFGHLMAFPQLIVECLIMAENVALVSDLYTQINGLRNDALALQYAAKALTMPQRNEDTSNFPAIDVHAFVLAGNDDHDSRARNIHKFSQAPFITLAKQLLDLCSNAFQAGQACLSMCGDLTRILPVSSPDQYSTLVAVIRQMVFYAKLRFLSTSEGNAGVALCDSLLSRVELMQQLVLCGFSVSLEDLTNAHTARHLRDQLIEADQMSLAMEVATKSRIETEQVWAAWGLTLLKLARYDDAREKFKYCLVERGGTPGAAQAHSNFDPAATLQEIIDVLETKPPLSSDHLKMLSLQLRAPMSPGGTQSSTPPLVQSMNEDDKCWTLHQYMSEVYLAPPRPDRRNARIGRSHLDSTRFLQCVQYIELYGTSEQLMAFYMRHNSMREAFSYLVRQKLSATMFVDGIVMPCLRRANVEELIKVLNGHPLESIQEYLHAACRCLATQNAPHLLYQLQVFMKDEVRAGMTSVQMFLNAVDFAPQLQHLANAEQHFEAAMSSMQQRRRRSQRGETDPAPAHKEALTEADVALSLKKVRRQMEVCKLFFEAQMKGQAPLQMSLFGSTNKQCGIAEQVVLLNSYALAFSIIQEFRLPAVPIYVNAAKKLIQRKQLSKVQDLLRNVKGTIQDREWDAVITGLIKIFAIEFEDPRTGEKYIDKLEAVDARCVASVICGNMRRAYTDAAQVHKDTGSTERMRWVRQQAELASNKRVRDYCDEFLRQREPDREPDDPPRTKFPDI